MLSRVLASAPSGGGSTPEVVYYIIGTLVAVAGMVAGAVRFYGRQRAKWQAEGEDRAAQTRAMEDNTAAAKANTEAIGGLSGKLDGFAQSVRSEFDSVKAALNGHGERISRLEGRKGGERQP